ncbi:MAG: MarR family transcriptional regulator [Actinomycetota bacterium]|nr:MarR family transcriptional regulator [Actinomycetota bacterium]
MADDQALLRAVERFAQPMEVSGMPRMAARVFAYVLAEDSDRYTASDLAQGLRVSPAAVSGAVRYLVNARLLFREREPGMRSDLYRVYDDDVWSAIMGAQTAVFDQYLRGVDEALELIGTDGPGGRRLLETREFFAFMQRETEEMMQRWRDLRPRITSSRS